MQVNRVGWSKNLMTPSKNAARRTTLMKYENAKKVLCIQWMDHKVILLTTTLVVLGQTNVNQRNGANILSLSVEKAKAYQEGMGRVDRSDQYQEHGSGFEEKTYFKK